MSTIPEYTPERAYMFARERESVRAKIEKIFDLHDTVSMEQLVKANKQSVDAMFNKLDWKTRCTDCAGFSGIEWNEQKQAQLDEVAKTMMYRILDGDQLALAVADKRTHKQGVGSDYFRGETLVEIYLNHVARDGIAHIKSLGFSDKSAVSLGGAAIKKAGALVTELGAIKPQYNKAASLEKNIDNIYTHWKLLRDILNNDREMNAMSLFEDTHQRQA